MKVHTDSWGEGGEQENIWATKGEENSKEFAFMSLTSHPFLPLLLKETTKCQNPD